MHANAIRNLLHDMKHDDITRHGFRSSFRDWAGENTSHPREVCELALAHDERDQTEGRTRARTSLKEASVDGVVGRFRQHTRAW